MVEVSGKTTLEDLVNECMNLDIKCDLTIIWKTQLYELREKIYITTGFTNALSPHKTRTKTGSVMICSLLDLVHINLTNTIYAANEGTGKQCSDLNQNLNRQRQSWRLGQSAFKWQSKKAAWRRIWSRIKICRKIQRKSSIQNRILL